MLPHSESLAQLRARASAYSRWIHGLRAGDAAFAEVSIRYPDDMNEWQAAVYLLTGCEEVWKTLGDRVCAELSMAAVIEQRERPCRPWSSSEDAVINWAGHFWDVDRWPASFPHVFDAYYFERWITACRLYRRTPPPTPLLGRIR